MSPSNTPGKADRLRNLGKRITKGETEQVKVPEHFKIGSKTETRWGIIDSNGMLRHQEPATWNPAKETKEEQQTRLLNLAVALGGKLGRLKCLVEYTPIEFTPDHDFTDGDI